MSNNNLKRNIALLFSIFLGIYSGINYKDFKDIYIICSDIYISLLILSILPITFFLVTSSVASLVTQRNTDLPISRTLIIMIVALMSGAIIAIGCSVAFSQIFSSYFEHSSLYVSIQKDALKNTLNISLDDTLLGAETFNLNNFIKNLIPRNIFNSLASGNILHVIIIAIFLGISIAFLESSKCKRVLNSLVTLKDIFTLVLKSTLLLLPIGLFFLIASNLSKVESDIFQPMLPFVLAIFGCYFIFGVINLILLRKYSSLKIRKSIKAIKEPLLIAFTSGSNQAALPFLIKILHEQFHFDKSQTETLTPLLITMCRTTSTAYFAFTSVFIASLYHTPLSMLDYGFIVIGSIFASLASSGSTSVLSFATISLVLTPLGLPLGSVGAILIILEPFIDPVRTFISTFISCGLACVIFHKPKIELKE